MHRVTVSISNDDNHYTTGTSFICKSKYYTSSVFFTLVLPDIFWKIDLKAFFLFSAEHE